MKINFNLETLIYAALIALCLLALTLSLLSYQFTDAKLVYEGF